MKSNSEQGRKTKTPSAEVVELVDTQKAEKDALLLKLRNKLKATLAAGEAFSFLDVEKFLNQYVSSEAEAGERREANALAVIYYVKGALFLNLESF